MKLLEGKICLVTGSNRGIGSKVIERFAEEGAVVYANARTEGCIDDVCEKLSSTYDGSVTPLYFDVTDEAAARAAIMTIKKESGTLDVLVNNAGIMKDALVGMINRELMQSIFDTNVFGTMNMLQLASKLMRKNKKGSIINFASIVGIHGNPGQLVYSASKGAVIALTKSASKELAPEGIRVNAVAPGMIDTEMFRSIGEEKVAERLQQIKMGRLGTPRDVADTCVYLASDLSEYVTGEIIGVNGAAII